MSGPPLPLNRRIATGENTHFKLKGGGRWTLEYPAEDEETNHPFFDQLPHQARSGQPFAHDAYLSQLTALRDQLKTGLSGTAPPEREPTVPELAERIKALRAAHTVEATPERTGKRRTMAEEPVTARIRRRTEERPADEGTWQRRLAEKTHASAERIREPG